MATDHLQIPDITASQSQKEVTANANFNLFDRALNGETAKTITGNDSLTTTEARENILVRLTGTPGAGFTLDMPDTEKRLICIQNDTGQSATVRNSAGGGTTVVVGDTQRKFIHYDGTDIRAIAQLDNGLGPHDISWFKQGTTSNNEILMKFVATRRFEFSDDFAGSYAHAEVAANGAHSYDVDVEGVKIGQIDFAAAAATATFSTTGAGTEIVEVGERVDIRAPATADSALASIAFSLFGTRIA